MARIAASQAVAIDASIVGQIASGDGVAMTAAGQSGNRLYVPYLKAALERYAFRNVWSAAELQAKEGWAVGLR